MKIQAVATQTGITAQTIRYYESVALLPKPHRLPNGYRDYTSEDVERIRFVAGARQLGLSMDDIREILALRDTGEAPCGAVLTMLKHKADVIQQHIVDLQRLEAELRTLHELGLTFPEEDILGKHCVCHLVREQVGTDSAEATP